MLYHKPTYLPTYLYTYIPTYLLTSAYLHTYLHSTYIHKVYTVITLRMYLTYVPTYIHTYVHTYLPNYIPSWFFLSQIQMFHCNNHIYHVHCHMTVEMITFDRRLQQELNIQLIKERKKWKKKILNYEWIMYEWVLQSTLYY